MVRDVLLIVLTLELLRLASKVGHLAHEIETSREDIRRLWREHVVGERIEKHFSNIMHTGSGSSSSDGGTGAGAAGVAAHNVEGGVAHRGTLPPDHPDS